MDANFNMLLNLYLEDKLTPEQDFEFWRMVNGGKNRELLEKALESVYKEEVEYAMTRPEMRETNLGILRLSHPDSARFRIFSLAAKWFAMAAGLTIFILAGLWVYDTRYNAPLPTGNGFDGKGFYYLPDSSTIILNDDSHLSYTYTRDRREVMLSGEAYFNVSHDPRRPFYVRTGKLLTKVLGTSFSVRAYPRQHDFMVAVTDGRVQVSDEEEAHSYGVVAPNEQLAVNPNTEAVIKTARKDPPVLDWRNAFLILNDVSLKQAAALIHERYGATLVFKNPELEGCEVNAKFLHDEDLATVLDIITTALGLTYTVEDGKFIINGTGCQ